MAQAFPGGIGPAMLIESNFKIDRGFTTAASLPAHKKQTHGNFQQTG
jgi:hypothetical protein